MTRTSRYFIKTSFLCFGLGIATGFWQYGHFVFDWSAPSTLIMAHTHIILIGGMMNMIIGVATWFFPRSKKGYKYYNPKFMWALYWVLAMATIGRFFAELFAGYQADRTLLVMAFWASVLQMVSLCFIFLQLWDRVRSKGSNIREQLGESF